MKVNSSDAVFSKMTEHAIRLGLLYGFVCGMIGGFPIFGIGALCGMPVGAITGAASGLVSSFALSAISLLAFNPLRKDRHTQYRIVAALVCLIVSALVGGIVFQGFIHTDDSVALGYLAPFLVIPGVLAVLRCSQGLADVYIKANPANLNPHITQFEMEIEEEMR